MMKNIIFILNENTTEQKKLSFIDKIKSIISALQLPFEAEVYTTSCDIKFEKYHYAVLAFPPKNIFSRFPNLEFILTTNVGYDDIEEECKNLSIPIGRLIYPPAILRIGYYVLYCILDYFLLIDKYRYNQAIQHWNRASPYNRAQNQLCIGIMGQGHVGLEIANRLMKNQLKVITYTKTSKNISMKNYTENEFDLFLAQCNILVNALPLTKETKNILNKRTLSLLPEHSCLINISRGGHLVEEDLLSILDTDKLAKVYLDVFCAEPLPKDHSFWNHPKIFITPHVSGAFDLLDIAELIVQNCKLFFEKSQVKLPIIISR